MCSYAKHALLIFEHALLFYPPGVFLLVLAKFHRRTTQMFGGHCALRNLAKLDFSHIVVYIHYFFLFGYTNREEGRFDIYLFLILYIQNPHGRPKRKQNPTFPPHVRIVYQEGEKRPEKENNAWCVETQCLSTHFNVFFLTVRYLLFQRNIRKFLTTTQRKL